MSTAKQPKRSTYFQTSILGGSCKSPWKMIEMVDFTRKPDQEKVTHFQTSNIYLGVSKNRGTPKWMVYNGKPY